MFEMNQTKSDFEDISFNLLNKSDSLFKDPNHSEGHYFDKTDYLRKYFHVTESNTFLSDLTRYEKFSLLNSNIISLRSNLDNFRTLSEESKISFNVICFTETWLKDYKFKTISFSKLRGNSL